MTTAQELWRRLHAYMPLFVALGDGIRLSIIEVLAEETLDSRQTSGPTHFERYGLNVNEVTRRAGPSCPAISHYLKILREVGIAGVRREGATNCYYLTLRESNHQPMGLGYRPGEFLC